MNTYEILMLNGDMVYINADNDHAYAEPGYVIFEKDGSAIAMFMLHNIVGFWKLGAAQFQSFPMEANND